MPVILGAMPNRTQQKTPAPHPAALHERAEDNLRFIRATMENSTSFTGISGMAYVLAGSSAVISAALAAQQPTAGTWLGVWMLDMLLAGTVLLVMTAHKAEKQGKPLWSTSGRKLLLAFLPAMVIGGVLTLALYLRDDLSLLPGLWLCLYGVAVMTAGAYSVRIIPLMGALFMLLGTAVLLAPLPPNLMLGLGFGGLHIVFGVLVWRRHGG
jgi:hypothetical protein